MSRVRTPLLALLAMALVAALVQPAAADPFRLPAGVGEQQPGQRHHPAHPRRRETGRCEGDGADRQHHGGGRFLHAGGRGQRRTRDHAEPHLRVRRHQRSYQRHLRPAAGRQGGVGAAGPGRPVGLHRSATSAPSTARPTSASPGSTSRTVRTSPGFNANVTSGKRVMDMSIDGNTLYLGGQFSKIGNHDRGRLRGAQRRHRRGRPAGELRVRRQPERRPTRIQRMDISPDGRPSWRSATSPP